MIVSATGRGRGHTAPVFVIHNTVLPLVLFRGRDSFRVWQRTGGTVDAQQRTQRLLHYGHVSNLGTAHCLLRVVEPRFTVHRSKAGTGGGGAYWEGGRTMQWLYSEGSDGGKLNGTDTICFYEIPVLF